MFIKEILANVFTKMCLANIAYKFVFTKMCLGNIAYKYVFTSAYIY